MADIAVVFHWDTDVMDRMTLNELMEWREEAALRATPEES